MASSRKLGSEFEQELKRLKNLPEAEIKNTCDEVKELKELKQFLIDSENQLIELAIKNERPPEGSPGELEFGTALYMLWEVSEWQGGSDFDTALKWGAKLLLFVMCNPKSKITKTDWDNIVTTLEGEGYIGGDGTPVQGTGTIKDLFTYVTFDPGWLLAPILYYRYGIQSPSSRAKFGSSPLTKTIKPEDYPAGLKIAVYGDFGTGSWTDGKMKKCPSEMVLEQMASLAPDIAIHLGDVYYAGTEGYFGISEEGDDFVSMLKNNSAISKALNLTLNSNHENYDGSNGYFNVALKDPLFSEQNGTSYFSLSIGEYLLIGLDSAYFDTSTLYMVGALQTGKGSNPQTVFLKEQGEKLKPGQKVIVMTHHTPVNATGDAYVAPQKGGGGLLWNQVTELLGREPDYWYWGHLHLGVVYNENSILSNKTKGRCSGHASMPFGDGYYLQNNDRVDYYAHTPMKDVFPDNVTEQQEKRVMNGFTMLTFHNIHGFTEAFYEVGATGPVRKYQSTN